jgi:hypothetical protein
MALAEILQDLLPAADIHRGEAHQGVEVVPAPLPLPLVFDLIQEVVLLGDVPGGVIEDAVRIQTVPACPAGFLVIAFHTLWQVPVNHVTDVVFIDPHAEGCGGYDHIHPILVKPLLVFASLLLGHARMVGKGGYSHSLQVIGGLFHVLAAQAVDDTCSIRPLLDRLGDLIQDTRFGLYGVVKLFAVKTGPDQQGILEAQDAYDVILHLEGGGGGKGR